MWFAFHSGAMSSVCYVWIRDKHSFSGTLVVRVLYFNLICGIHLFLGTLVVRVLCFSLICGMHPFLGTLVVRLLCFNLICCLHPFSNCNGRLRYVRICDMKPKLWPTSRLKGDAAQDCSNYLALECNATVTQTKHMAFLEVWESRCGNKCKGEKNASCLTTLIKEKYDLFHKYYRESRIYTAQSTSIR